MPGIMYIYSMSGRRNDVSFYTEPLLQGAGTADSTTMRCLEKCVRRALENDYRIEFPEDSLNGWHPPHRKDMNEIRKWYRTTG